MADIGVCSEQRARYPGRIRRCAARPLAAARSPGGGAAPQSGGGARAAGRRGGQPADTRAAQPGTAERHRHGAAHQPRPVGRAAPDGPQRDLAPRQRLAAARGRGHAGDQPPQPDRAEAARPAPLRFHRQCQPRAAHAADLARRLHRHAARAGRQGRGGARALPQHHAPAGGAHVEPHRRSVVAEPHRDAPASAADRQGRPARGCSREVRDGLETQAARGGRQDRHRRRPTARR